MIRGPHGRAAGGRRRKDGHRHLTGRSLHVHGDHPARHRLDHGGQDAQQSLAYGLGRHRDIGQALGQIGDHLHPQATRQRLDHLQGQRHQLTRGGRPADKGPFEPIQLGLRSRNRLSRAPASAAPANPPQGSTSPAQGATPALPAGGRQKRAANPPARAAGALRSYRRNCLIPIPRLPATSAWLNCST